MTTCDVVVIGLGPGGEALASRLAGEGLDVVAVESGLVGGECPYWGCIPSKMFIRAAGAVAETRRAAELAGAATVEPDFSVVARRIREEATDDWDDTVAAERLERSGARLLRGHGRLAGPRVVEVDLSGGGTTRVEARRGVVLNPGTRASVPPIDGLADTPFWTNHEALEASVLPATLAVVGGGPIGLELAQAFARFGSEVTVVEVGPRILGPEEPEAADVLRGAFERDGIDVREGERIVSVSHDGQQFTLELASGTLHVEQLLVAAGRTPQISDIGLDTVGLDPTARSIDVDDAMQAADGLWVVGDVAGRGAFTHVSMYQSDRAARAVLGETLPDYDGSFPRVTFTDPEVGGVGLTEKQAREQGIDVRVASTDLAQSSRGFTHGPGAEGVVKLVLDAARGVLVGATVVGPTGGETVSGLAVAVRAEVPVSTLRNSVYAYPTFWRAVESALGELD
ncbi:NAD(P)/FAD-dependent oxidoreductase [uncultured Aeromicrobium sp.]|jgi:pyruvate/2-oxoglutarate dehydrogenase complex dihydrolipoamide dehydrogenase (E3) component|nr:NAD(P)/FAD-dependent oxidoreductase [uncultured Aeromicrobium sp.]